MSYKKIIYSLLISTLTTTILNAGIPLDPDAQEEAIRSGREFRAVGRIEYAPIRDNTPKVLSEGSGTLIDSTELGLPPEFKNRVVLTAGHVFTALTATFKRGMPKQYNSEESRQVMNAFRFCIDTEEDQTKPPVENFFEIQSVFFSNRYRPNNKAENHVDDIAFAILKTPLVGIEPMKIVKMTADDVIGLNVQRVGYGMSGFLNSNTFFFDSVKRAGGTTITSSDPTGTILYNDMRTDTIGTNLDTRPKAKSSTYLRPGYDSITLTVDGQKRALEINAINDSIDSPELQMLLEKMSVIRLKFELSKLIETISPRSKNRSILVNKIAGVQLSKEIRISRGVHCPSYCFSGDSGGPAVAHTNAGWAIVGITVRETGTFRVVDRTPFKEKLKNYASNNPCLQKIVPKSWLKPVAAPSFATEEKEEKYPAKLIPNGPDLIQRLGVDGYVSKIDTLDGHFFKRRWSRLKHGAALSTNTYFYPNTTSTIAFPRAYAEAFANSFRNSESSSNPENLVAPIYSFAFNNKILSALAAGSGS